MSDNNIETTDKKEEPILTNTKEKQVEKEKRKDDYLDICICVWGDHYVGKYCFIERFINKTWKPRLDISTEIISYYSRTECFSITADLDIHIIPSDIDEKNPKLQEILKKCVSNILCYSVEDKTSLISLETKWQPLAQSLKERVPCAYVCTKIDRLSNDITSIHEKARNQSVKHNCFWYSCSAKENDNICETLEACVTAGMSFRVGEVTRNKEYPEKPSTKFDNNRVILKGLFAPQRCSICQSGIEYKEYYYQCFSGECKTLKNIFCEQCIKENSHEHKTYKELLQRGSNRRGLTGKLVKHTLINVFNRYKDRPIFGWSTRHKRESYNGELYVLTHNNKIQWITYYQFYRRCLYIGRGMIKYGNVKQGDFIGTCGSNKVEWYISNIGCILHNIRGIAVHTTYSIDDLHHLITNARLKGIFCDSSLINKFITVLKTYPGCLNFIISLDPLSNKEIQNIKKDNELDDSFLLSDFPSLELLGQQTRAFDDCELTEFTSKSIFVLQYTSGSTGKPKGVVITDEAYNYDLIPRSSPIDRSLTISYEPLAHSSYDNDFTHLCGGHPNYLYQDPMGDQFFEDLQLVNPTSLAGVPRIYNSIYSQYKMVLQQKINSNSNITEEIKIKIEEETIKTFGTLFGNRIRTLTIGGAPSSIQVQNFLKRAFNCMLFNSYGTTESGGISANGHKSLDVEVILLDVPELGYTTQDKPYPRGEIAVRSKTQGKGYYREPELTKNTWTEEGFIRTGDIAVLESNNQFRIITRRKNICKLAQGEFVDPDKLQNIYLKHNLIDQIYVDVNSIQEVLVVVIVPIFPLLIEQLNILQENIHDDNIIKDTLDTRYNLCLDKNVINMFLNDLEDIAKNDCLLSYEYIRGIVLTTEQFTVENELQTSSNKLCRHKIAKKYEKQLSDVYETIGYEKYHDAANYIEDLMNQVTGNTKDNSCKGKDFIERGGDSLSAINLIRLLHEKFNVEVPLDILYDTNSNSPQQLASIIAQEKIQKAPDSRNDLQKRITEDCLLSPEFNILTEESYNNFNMKNILLTGGNGFIGMYILKELLIQYPICKIYCLLRSLSKDIFIDKLQQLQLNLSNEQIDRIIVITGDLSKPLFNLSESLYNELTENIDTIFHCGALVNHFLSYKHLYQTNVEGTKRILQLCVTNKAKELHYISTVGVLHSVDGTKDPPLQDLPCPFGSGYGTSKYVAEICVIKAKENGLRTTIYRPSQIAGHSITGHAIPEHYINRLLLSFIFLNCIPNSSSRIELTSVDYCARSIVGISKCKESIGNTYNISDPRSTVSLQSLYEFLKQLGYTIESVKVNEWVSKLFNLLSTTSFEDKLNNKKYQLLRPLTNYFDSQMSNFPSSFTPYVGNTQEIMKINDCIPKSASGISQKRIEETIKFLTNNLE